MILQIATRELRSLFLSPLAWIIMGVIQAIMAWKFLGFIDVFFALQPDLINIKNAPGVTDLVVAPLFDFSKVLLLIICPLITMRLLIQKNYSQLKLANTQLPIQSEIVTSISS